MCKRMLEKQRSGSDRKEKVKEIYHSIQATYGTPGLQASETSITASVQESTEDDST